MAELLNIEVVYALPERQSLKLLAVAPGCTALDAVLQSGLAEEFPGLDPRQLPMGVFSKPLDGKTLPLPADYPVKAGDRIELYRPLVADPKQVRQQRAAKARAARKSG